MQPEGEREASSFKEWFAWLCESRDKEKLEAFAMITWSIRNARNKLRFKEVYSSPEACVHKAMDLLQEYRKVGDQLQKPNTRTEAQWRPPSEGNIKVNFDAAINAEGGRSVRQAKTLFVEWSPELGEARAALEALTVTHEEGYNSIEVEGDAQVVIRALQGLSSRSGAVQLLVDDAKAYVNILNGSL
ncbi:ADP-dependent glucokinase [Bienertia sinuspersici]